MPLLRRSRAHGKAIWKSPREATGGTAVGISAWHPSPRAGDTRRGILASLLRDCNLGGHWNHRDGDIGTGTTGTGTQLRLLCTGALHSQRERAALFPPGPSIHLSVVKCRGGWSCEGRAGPLGRPRAGGARRARAVREHPEPSREECSGSSGTIENFRNIREPAVKTFSAGSRAAVGLGLRRDGSRT